MYRADFSDDLWVDIEAAVHRWLEHYQHGSKRAYDGVRAEDVMDGLRNNPNIHVVYVGGYVLVVGVGAPWYAPHKPVLEELLVMRVGQTPASFRVIPQTLLKIAALIPNCDGIAVGTSFVSDKRLGRVYQRYGFVMEAESLYRKF